MRGLEFVAFVLLAFQVFHFSRVADFNANGIDALVARYGPEVEELHRKLDAIALVKEQISRLSTLKADLGTKPPHAPAQQLLQGMDEFATALRKLDQVEEKTWTINMQLGKYDPGEVTSQATRPYLVSLDLEPVSSVATRRNNSLRKRTGNLPKALQENAIATEELRELTGERARLLAEVSDALAARIVLESDRSERRASLADAVARLVALKGVDQATETIRGHFDDLAQDVSEGQAYNAARLRDFAEYRVDYRVYLTEARACARIARALEDFFAKDPDAELLVTKLNATNPEERAKRGLIPAHEGPRGPPSLSTKGPNDDAVRNKIERDVIESLPQPSDAADRINVNYQQQFTEALGRIKATPESFVRRFLEGKLGVACATNADGAAVVAELKNLARTL